VARPIQRAAFPHLHKERKRSKERKYDDPEVHIPSPKKTGMAIQFTGFQNPVNRAIVIRFIVPASSLSLRKQTRIASAVTLLRAVGWQKQPDSPEKSAFQIHRMFSLL
jgi:hypothetical protein